MNKKEANMKGFEMVAYSGDARSCFIEALRCAKAGDWDKAEELIEEGKENILLAHDIQTQILAAEAGDEEIELGYIMIHGQDSMMTTFIIKDLMEFLLDIYKGR